MNGEIQCHALPTSVVQENKYNLNIIIPQSGDQIKETKSFAEFLLSIVSQYKLLYTMRPVVAQEHKCVTVNATGCVLCVKKMKYLLFFQLYAVSRTQHGRHREPSVKTRR